MALGGRELAVLRSAAAAQAAAAIASALSGALLAVGVPETIKERSQFDVSKANPFGFTALLRGDSEYNKPTNGAIRRL